jgi:hypothetical protein
VREGSGALPIQLHSCLALLDQGIALGYNQVAS